MLRDGAGVGGDLANRASADRRMRKLSLDSTCPDVRSYIAKPHVPGLAPRNLSVGQDTSCSGELCGVRVIPAVDVAVVQVKAAHRMGCSYAVTRRDWRAIVVFGINDLRAVRSPG